MSFVILNQCDKIRVKTKDGVVMQVFSAFYRHPAMINEDAWHLVKHGNLRLLIDTDTMEIMKDLECEWGFSPKSDTIMTCKLTSCIRDKEKRNAQFGEKLEYAKGVRSSMETFFDAKKVDELSAALDSIDITELSDSDSHCSDQATRKTLADQE